jgi:hypothetical protein
MDFHTNKKIEPFAMYIFEFFHELSREDLAHIWQNILPDIGVTAKKKDVTLSHPSGINEFFRGAPIPTDTRWMVFKVKKKANKDYYKVTADTTDDHQFQFDFKQGDHKTIPDYSYNWPYDFFSLIELVKIDTMVELAGHGHVTTPTPAEVTGPEADLAGAAEVDATAVDINVGGVGESIPGGLDLGGMGGMGGMGGPGGGGFNF